MSTSGVVGGTGRDRPEWFALLDAWGAAGRPYRETAAWLRDAHGLSAWWAQKLTVEYEQARGTRAPGVRRDGTFEVTASKAIHAPLERVFAAVADPAQRAAWLPALPLRERATTPGSLVRFDLEEAGERVSVTFASPGPDRTSVAVQHQHLPDLAAADHAKAAWRDRLAALKAHVEG